MRRALRWILVGLLVLPLLVIVSGIAILFGASRDDIVLRSVQEITEATGLRVEIGETFEPVLLPIPGWRLGSVKLIDPATEAEASPLLVARESLLTIAPRGLLQRTLKIGALWLEDVQIHIPAQDSKTKTLVLPKRTPKVAFVRLRNAEITIGAGGSDPEQTVRLSSASLDYAGAKRPVRVALNGNWRNRQIAGKFKLTSPDRAVRGDWVFADARIAIDSDTVTYTGRFKPDLASKWPIMAGNATARVANPAGALSWLLQTPPDETLINLSELTLEGRVETLPERLLLRSRWAGMFHETRVSLDTTLRADANWQISGAGTLNAVARAGGLFSSHLNGSFARDQGISGDLSFSVLDLPGMFDAGLFPQEYQLSNAKNGSVKGRLSATAQGVALADTRLVLGRDSYRGDAAIDLRGERPLISLGTSLDLLSLDAWADPILQGKQPLDRILPNLAADLVLEVNAETIQYQDFAAGPAIVAVSTRLDALSFDLRQLDVAGGVLAGSLTTGPNSSRAKLELSGAEIDSAEMLKQFGLSGIDGILGGSVRANLPFPPDTQLLDTVQADGTFSLFQTQIEGVDLRRRTAGRTARSTLTQADAAFSLDGEALTFSDIVLRDPLGEWSGTGSVDITSRALNAALVSETSPSSLLRLSGTLDAPSLETTSPEPSKAGTSIEPAAPEPTSNSPEASGAPEQSETTTTPRITPEQGTVSIVPVAATSTDEPEPDVPETGQTAETADIAATGPETAPLPRRPRR